MEPHMNVDPITQTPSYCKHLQASAQSGGGSSHHNVGTDFTLNGVGTSVPNMQIDDSAYKVYLCVQYGSHNKQRLFPQQH
jgi:hypothetical protein